MSDANAMSGAVILYINQAESRNATPELIRAWCEFAESIGADTISPKVGEGGACWFSFDEIRAFRAAALAAGRGYLPFWYSRGDLDIAAEARELAALMRANGNQGISIDMEDTWNGKASLASEYAALLRPIAEAGPIYISTWADPAEQDWDAVAAALAPVIACFCPQQYSDWLAWASGQEWHVDPARLQPQLDLTEGEFGADNAVAIATAARAAGHRAIWLWEHAAAAAHPALARQVVSAFRDIPPPPPPTAPRHYIVRPGDTLAAIAQRFYGNPAEWPRIFHANSGLIIDPDRIQIGWDLVIP